MFPNQKTVIVDNPKVNVKSGRQYILIYTKDVENAAKNLNGTAFKVYMYFVGLSDGFQCEYSPKHIQKAYGVSEDSARDALKELRSKGFLTQQNEKTYIFHRNPSDEIVMKIERRRFVGESGAVKNLTLSEVRQLVKKKHGSEEDVMQIWNTAPRIEAV